MQRLINSRTGAPIPDEKMWTGALADQRGATDDLRARYNPTYAAIRQYLQAKAEIKTANALGALSTDEMTAALSRERQAALASIDAIKGRNRALVDTRPRVVVHTRSRAPISRFRRRIRSLRP